MRKPHTPGPFKVGTSPLYGPNQAILDAQGIMIVAQIPDTEEGESNVLLFQHAPELKKQLEIASRTINSLKLSMMAHPDHIEDSEFDGFTDLAQKTQDSIEKLLKKIDD